MLNIDRLTPMGIHIALARIQNVVYLYPGTLVERSAQWFAEGPRVPLGWRHGGRCATILDCTLEQFAARVGDPHEAAPVEQWRKYWDFDLIDGAGKVSAQWDFETPRGLVQVSDYWWNPADQLSVRATDRRAVRWFRRWGRFHRFNVVGGCGRSDAIHQLVGKCDD